MALNSIAEEWDRFSEMAFRGTNPCDVQREEMKKSFFAGAWAVFNMFEEMGTPGISEEQGLDHCEEIRCECMEFKSHIMQQYQERN